MKIREQQLDLIHGDSTQELAAFRDNSFDALVTDPPAGIAFLNKQWDSDKGGRDQWVAWLSTILKECYRVLKPGAHGLIWSIPRTSHWAAWAAEDAGFDILNVVTHIFGTGFPKGLDLSKALDKVNAEPGRELKFTKWMRTTGLTIAKINDITGTFMGSHYLTDKSQPAIPTRELWVKLRPFCGNVPAWVDKLVQRIEAEREVVGKYKTDVEFWHSGQCFGLAGGDITIPATTIFKQYDGFRTGLKPATEFWILVRKPLDGNVANNVLTWGTGGLNIDKCRVGTALVGAGSNKGDAKRTLVLNHQADFPGNPTYGRYPANLVLSHHPDCRRIGTKRVPSGGNNHGEPLTSHRFGYDREDGESTSKSYADVDGMEEVEEWRCVNGCPVRELDESTMGCSDSGNYKVSSGTRTIGSLFGVATNVGVRDYGDRGNASRFFYCSKASPDEKMFYLPDSDLVVSYADGIDYLNHLRKKYNNNIPPELYPVSHPTQKSLELMRWLVRLITPPHGCILDPFAGTGATLKAALWENFKATGIEFDYAYCQIALAQVERERVVITNDSKSSKTFLELLDDGIIPLTYQA